MEALATCVWGVCECTVTENTRGVSFLTFFSLHSGTWWYSDRCGEFSHHLLQTAKPISPHWPENSSSALCCLNYHTPDWPDGGHTYPGQICEFHDEVAWCFSHSFLCDWKWSFIKSFAQQKGCDVFSALDVMDNSSFLEQLKFTTDDASLHYYLYNWMCPKMTPDKVNLHVSSITPFF